MEFTEKCKKIKAIVMDFDGVMTDNMVYITDTGREMVRVCRADGMGTQKLGEMGYKLLILSSEKNNVVVERAKKLNIEVINGIADKVEALKQYSLINELNFVEIAYVGNDYNDLGAIRLCGLSFCPIDAHECVKIEADIILKTPGGHGVIREMADFFAERRKL